MSIAYAAAWVQAVWRYWKVNLTGGSIIALLFLYQSTGKMVPSWVYVAIAAVTLFLSCFLAWKEEYQRILVLVREFVIPELERIRHDASPSSVLVFHDEESEFEFYFAKLKASGSVMDKYLVKRALAIWKKHKPIVSETGIRPSVHRL